MRELIASLVCVAALCIAVGSSYVFAVRHNAAVPIVDIPTTVDQTTVAQPFPSTLATPSTLIPAPVSSGTPTATSSAPIVPTPGQESGAVGRESFKNRGCSTCHSVAGTGNPRHPLEGVGARWTPEQLRAWITGSGFATERLPASVARRKQQYTRVPEEEMNALISFLSGLKTTQYEK